MADKCDICGEADMDDSRRCENCTRVFCHDCVDWCGDDQDDAAGVYLCLNCQDENERANDGQGNV